MPSSRVSIVEIATERVHTVGRRTRIGRGPDADIRLDDPMVSLAHADLIRNDDGTLTVIDLGSRHGTFAGRQRTTQALLRNGDELLIGPVALRVAVAAVADDADELRRLRAVVELARVIGVEHDVDTLLGRVITTLMQLVPADRAAVVVYDSRSRTPQWTVTRDRIPGRPPLAISTSVLSQLMADPRPFLRTELDTDALDRSQSLLAQDVRSLMVVPLLYQATTAEWLGVIHLDCQGDGPRFRDADLELVVAVASQAALAIKNALLVAQIQTVRDEQWHRLERVVHHLPVGVVVLDNQHRCVLANPWAMARPTLLGALAPGEVVTALVGLEPGRLTAADAPLTVTVDQRTLTMATAIAGDGSETVVVLADVTEQRAGEDRAAHQDRLMLLGQLAGGVAHDFNNLLSVILNYASFLEADLEQPTMKDDAKQILHAANRAAELTRQLLAFSRRDSATPTVVDVGKLIRGLERTLGRTLGEQVQLVTSIADGLPPVRIDPGQLEQVIMNLLVNARDAMPDGGLVSLRVMRAIKTPHLVLEVRDNGPGIAPEIARRVFEPYFTTKALGKGTGLGLAMVHGIVQQAGGDITVQSQPGRGALFRILLPSTTAELTAEPVTAVSVAVQGATVLVVDDDDGVRRLSERILKQAGYVVVSALSGPAALAFASEHPGVIDLLLSDMVMPGMSGRELAHALVEQRPGIKVLFMSGYDPGATAPRQKLIAKPFSRQALLDAVSEAMGLSA